MADFADAFPRQLSGGMAQRTAIARGLFTQPSLLLLDEPFSAVDAFTRMRLQELLLSIAAHHGTTLLLVTHDVNEAVYLSDRVLVFSSNPGQIRGEIAVNIPRARDRVRGARLAQRESEVLTLLNGGESRYLDYLDIRDEIASIPRQYEPINLDTFAFAL
ncbi:ATP-binding cassette domain-containing protein [Propionivibrio sp.]|uniref:ATP-binding cassette domain-containing protein n=1 Tax=Propionivibrio sp. TaxID=2212460 RepID=UPI003BF0C9A6